MRAIAEIEPKILSAYETPTTGLSGHGDLGKDIQTESINNSFSQLPLSQPILPRHTTSIVQHAKPLRPSKPDDTAISACLRL
jgi:hypothetical protein